MLSDLNYIANTISFSNDQATAIQLLMSERSSARRGPAPTKHLDILWTAVELFGRQGVGQTTTRQIAAAANTTERTLFKHFASKDRLVEAVMREAVIAQLAPASLNALRQAIGEAQDDLVAWHRSLLHERMQATGKATELTRLLLVELLRDETVRKQFGKQWQSAAWKPLVALLVKLQGENKLRTDLDAAALARMFLSLNVGHLVGRFILAPGARWNDEQDIAAIAELFAHGARPAKG
ncbi:TetR/AcrR family transcriptional regulator [uncultured Bradyrhizobium sp.]|uniref:TetR/AcrR family transcriptional regulator n=1 Tax=uncultured Bradyrhizobium sp. TaxID=199684 RepID=UPI002625EA8A|nr:TetR/AcrR family transcriptional regulator [uncultured Bradyrhizobium sp.]